MTPAPSQPFDWAHLTENHAAILEAYFSLYQERDPDTIGSTEILGWLSAHGRKQPSEGLIRTVLGAVEAPRRGSGRPANETRRADSPFLSAIRTQYPRPRKPPR